MTTLLEFDARFVCEAYPRPGESPLAILERGDFQHGVPTLLRYRTYKLNEYGVRCNFGEWIEVEGEVRLRRFYE